MSRSGRIEAVRELAVEVDSGHAVRAHDGGDAGGPAVLWCHGTPNTGRPPEPLFAAAAAHGVRWIGIDRPGYGGSTPRPGRRVADAAGDVRAVLDALGIARVAVLSHSGGGPGALATAALLPERVSAVAALASPAPRDGDDEAWLAGLAPGPRRGLAAAIDGRQALTALLEAGEEDGGAFTADDLATLAGPWSWFGGIVREGLANGPGPMVDDDLALVAPWGFDLGAIAAPVLLVAGGADRMVPAAHSARLAAAIPGARSVLVPGAGHLSVLVEAPAALAAIVAQTAV